MGGIIIPIALTDLEAEVYRNCILLKIRNYFGIIKRIALIQ